MLLRRPGDVIVAAAANVHAVSYAS